MTDPAGRSLRGAAPADDQRRGADVVTFGDAWQQRRRATRRSARHDQRQGELARAALNFATGQVAPKYLTQDATVNWLPAAAYDPLLGVSLATAVKGAEPTGLVGLAQAARADDNPAPDLPIGAAIVPDLPDFVLSDVTVTGGPATGDPLQAIVQIANNGAAWPGSAEQPLGNRRRLGSPGGPQRPRARPA